jgi:excisionase family DNA binding protein
MTPPPNHRSAHSGGKLIPFPAVRRDEQWLTKRQLADYLGYSTRWVEYRVREGLPNTWMGNQRRFRISEVEGWLAARRSA